MSNLDPDYDKILQLLVQKTYFNKKFKNSNTIKFHSNTKKQFKIVKLKNVDFIIFFDFYKIIVTLTQFVKLKIFLFVLEFIKLKLIFIKFYFLLKL